MIPLEEIAQRGPPYTSDEIERFLAVAWMDLGDEPRDASLALLDEVRRLRCSERDTREWRVRHCGGGVFIVERRLPATPPAECAWLQIAVLDTDLAQSATLTQKLLAERAPMHAGAPHGMRCADCTMGKVPCWPCYRVWYRRTHPHVHFIPEDDEKTGAR